MASTRLDNLARAIMTAMADEDAAAFTYRGTDPAPASGEDYTPGFVLVSGPNGSWNVVSTLPSNNSLRHYHMAAYRDTLSAAGFTVDTRERNGTVTAVKVVP